MKQEIAGGAALLVLAAAYLIGASGIPHSTLSDEVGARGMPYLLGSLLVLVAIGIIARGAFAAARAPVEADAEERSTLPRVAGILAIAAMYVGVAWIAGYFAACAATLLAIMLYEGAGLNARTVAVAAVGALAFWLTFAWFLGVQQPVGKLFGG